MIRMLSALDGAVMRLGYALPRARMNASEEQLLLLDSMEAGFARASMSMSGSGRLAALIRIEGPEIVEAELVAALATLRERHALMRRTIRRTRLGLALGPCDIASSASVSFTDDDDGWRAAWREIEALPLREGHPLVSVYVIKQRTDPRRADLLLVIEHIISDGASLVSLAKELLEILTPGARSDTTGTTCVDTFPPSVVAMAAERVGGTLHGLARMAKASMSLAERDRDNPHVRLPRASGPRFDECHTHVVSRDLEPDFYDALFARARSEKVSVSAAFIAALALSFADREQQVGVARDVHHVLPHVTVDLRGRYAKRVAHGDLGVHIATIDPCISIEAYQLDVMDGSALFAIARAVRGEMQELLRAGVDRHFLGALVAGVGLLLPRYVPEQSFGSFVFTDAAAFAIPARLSGFDVVSVAALANCRAQSLPYVVTTRSARQTTISMMAPSPAFSPDDLEMVLDSAVARLARALGRTAAS